MQNPTEDLAVDPTAELFYAIQNNDNDGIKAAIENGAILDAVNKTRFTPLECLIMKNNAEGFRILLDAGAIPPRLTRAFYAPHPNETIIKLLIDHGADVLDPRLSNREMDSFIAMRRRIGTPEDRIFEFEKVKRLIQRERERARLFRERSAALTFYEGHVPRDENGTVFSGEIVDPVERYLLDGMVNREIISFIGDDENQNGGRKKARKSRRRKGRRKGRRTTARK